MARARRRVHFGRPCLQYRHHGSGSASSPDNAPDRLRNSREINRNAGAALSRPTTWLSWGRPSGQGFTVRPAMIMRWISLVRVGRGPDHPHAGAQQVHQEHRMLAVVRPAPQPGLEEGEVGGVERGDVPLDPVQHVRVPVAIGSRLSSPPDCSACSSNGISSSAKPRARAWTWRSSVDRPYIRWNLQLCRSGGAGLYRLMR